MDNLLEAYANSSDENEPEEKSAPASTLGELPPELTTMFADSGEISRANAALLRDSRQDSSVYGRAEPKYVRNLTTSRPAGGGCRLSLARRVDCCGAEVYGYFCFRYLYENVSLVHFKRYRFKLAHNPLLFRHLSKPGALSERYEYDMIYHIVLGTYDYLDGAILILVLVCLILCASAIEHVLKLQLSITHAAQGTSIS